MPLATPNTSLSKSTKVLHPYQDNIYTPLFLLDVEENPGENMVSMINIYINTLHTFLDFVCLTFFNFVLIFFFIIFLFQEVVGDGEFKVCKINILRLFLPCAACVFTL